MLKVLNKKSLSFLALSLSISVLSIGCTVADDMHMSLSTNSSEMDYSDSILIKLSGDKAVIDGVKVEEYDYTWHCDPSVSHDEVENAPAEYYTGNKPDTEAAAYIDHELYYYPKVDDSLFTLVNYDGEQEWAYYYNDGENDEYIFATLPRFGDGFSAHMMHTPQEAAENKVLHITKAGSYVLRGNWNGQIKVDLGEDAFDDESAVVTLILDGIDIVCSVAPGLIFYNVYECDNQWKNRENYDVNVDTTNAGANIILADNSLNHISGSNVYRMLKTKYKNEDSTDEIKPQKKMRKNDGALYSYMSINIDGEDVGNGQLVVDSGFEGIDSELHMTINGGSVIISSMDDGINVNEDHVSVLSFTGGQITINAALGEEGDGVDSNGFIRINGGYVAINGIRVPDSALDSEDGIYYESGQILIDGEEQHYNSGDVFKETKDTQGRFDIEELEKGKRPEDGMMPPKDRGEQHNDKQF